MSRFGDGLVDLVAGDCHRGLARHLYVEHERLVRGIAVTGLLTALEQVDVASTNHNNLILLLILEQFSLLPLLFHLLSHLGLLLFEQSFLLILAQQLVDLLAESHVGSLLPLILIGGRGFAGTIVSSVLLVLNLLVSGVKRLFEGHFLRLLLLLRTQVSVVTLLAAAEADDALVAVELLRLEDLSELGSVDLVLLTVGLLVTVLAAVMANDRLLLLLLLSGLLGSAVVVVRKRAHVASVLLRWTVRLRKVFAIREVG